MTMMRHFILQCSSSGTSISISSICSRMQQMLHPAQQQNVTVLVSVVTKVIVISIVTITVILAPVFLIMVMMNIMVNMIMLMVVITVAMITMIALTHTNSMSLSLSHTHKLVTSIYAITSPSWRITLLKPSHVPIILWFFHEGLCRCVTFTRGHIQLNIGLAYTSSCCRLSPFSQGELQRHSSNLCYPRESTKRTDFAVFFFFEFRFSKSYLFILPLSSYQSSLEYMYFHTLQSQKICIY